MNECRKRCKVQISVLFLSYQAIESLQSFFARVSLKDQSVLWDKVLTEFLFIYNMISFLGTSLDRVVLK